MKDRLKVLMYRRADVLTTIRLHTSARQHISTSAHKKENEKDINTTRFAGFR